MSLRKVFERWAGLDQSKLFRMIMIRPKVQELIINLNTEDQLFKKGENALGVSLEDIGGGYAPFTIQQKLEKGQPVDRVTLKDTGEFYESWVIEVGVNFFEMNADPIKDDTNLFEEWGEDILGLQDENLQKFIDLLTEEFIELTREILLDN